MSSPISDNDFDSLINEGSLGLMETEQSESAAPQQPHQDLSFFGKIPVNVTLEVASTEVSLQELMDVDAGSVIALDKLAGEPLDVKVNGALFARAEVVVMNGNYGLRVVELAGDGLSKLGA